MTRHIDIVGLLFYVWGAFQLCLAAFIGFIYGGMGALFAGIGASEGEEEMIMVGSTFLVISVIFVGMIAVFSIPSFLAGWGIRKRAPWGRIVGIVIGALAITSVPIGTALGIYALITLIDKDVAREFDLAAARG